MIDEDNDLTPKALKIEINLTFRQKFKVLTET